jgi:hypothetical protein
MVRARYNASSHLWTLPSGTFFEINQLENVGDYNKFQGRDFTLLLIDEAGQWPEPQLLDLMRSNLRGPEGVPVRVVLAGNPGGVGHQWLAQRYVFKASPWTPFLEEKSGRQFVYCPSVFVDNDFIDQDGYRKQIEAATVTDPELGRAWLEGDWTVARGAYFGGVLEESRNCIDPWPVPVDENDPESWWSSEEPSKWRWFLAYDHGSAAPAVCFVVAESPGGEGPDGRFYPRDSLVLIDEMHTAEPGSFSKGMQYTIPIVAEQILELCERWGVKPRGCADDACFAYHGSGTGSIADEFKRCGVYFYPAKKADRITGWERLRRLMADAGQVDVPGLYVSRICEGFWATVPYLARDPRRVEDVDSRSNDHWADAARYAVTAVHPSVSSRKFRVG